MKILAISGSLRKQSYNTIAINALVELSPEGVEIDTYVPNELPFMNQDLEDNLPNSVQDLVDKLKIADAIVICTPEHNNTISAVTKNVIEWMSRGYSQPHVANKVLGIMGASDGGFGTVRAQNKLLELGAILGMRVHGTLRLPISKAQESFDENGKLTDEDLKNKMEDFISKLVKIAKQ